jgi:hypothetical protein
MKYSLTLNFPIEFVKIKNGERVIVDAGPVEPVLELLDGDIEGENPLLEVLKLLDQAEGGVREYKRRNRRSR